MWLKLKGIYEDVNCCIIMILLFTRQMQEMQICLQLLTPALQPDKEVLQAVAPEEWPLLRGRAEQGQLLTPPLAQAGPDNSSSSLRLSERSGEECEINRIYLFFIVKKWPNTSRCIQNFNLWCLNNIGR